MIAKVIKQSKVVIQVFPFYNFGFVVKRHRWCGNREERNSIKKKKKSYMQHYGCRTLKQMVSKPTILWLWKTVVQRIQAQMKRAKMSLSHNKVHFHTLMPD